VLTAFFAEADCNLSRNPAKILDAIWLKFLSLPPWGPDVNHFWFQYPLNWSRSEAVAASLDVAAEAWQFTIFFPTAIGLADCQGRSTAIALYTVIFGNVIIPLLPGSVFWLPRKIVDSRLSKGLQKPKKYMSYQTYIRSSTQKNITVKKRDLPPQKGF